MLYLIKDRDYIKIGYTQDITSRWKNYKLHNCYVELLYTKPGSRIDEKEIHALCNKYLYQGDRINIIKNNCILIKQQI